MHYESEATLSRVLSKIYNGKSRHISLRHEYVRQFLSDDIVTIVYIRSYNNLADSFTKALSRDKVKAMSLGIGLNRVANNRNLTFIILLLFKNLMVIITYW